MKYKIYYQKNNKLKSKILIANSIEQLKYNKNCPLNIIDIQEIKKYDFKILKNDEEKISLFYEMNLMLKSNLNFEEVIDILLESNFNKENKEVLHTMKHTLKTGQNFSITLQEHINYLGENIINFFKISDENGNIKNTINSIYIILNKNKQIKSSILNALTYPLILIISLFVSVFVIFNFVLPKFDYIFVQFGDKLPKSTQILLDIKYVLDNYSLYIFLTIIFTIYIIKILYSMYEEFFDKFILLNIPAFSNMYKNILFFKLFLAISQLVNLNYRFQDAYDNSIKISKNKYLNKLLLQIKHDIYNGMPISKAFKNTNIFDSFVIRLLTTAQKTNKMDIILKDILEIYENKLNKSIKIFQSFLEPFLIFVIASIILYLVLAIMTPIWDLSQIIQ